MAGSAKTEPVFQTRDLTKTYHMGETEVHALRGVDVEIPKGELDVLLGPSGSGKSTFLNILGGLDRPTSGDVYFFGEKLTTYGDDQLTLFRREHVGFVFQFYNLIPSLTALENVKLVTEISKTPMQPMKALDIVGLAERANHFPSQMSGGEQQRVSIARAIAKQPEILLCDEPTGALDIKTGLIVLDALIKVNQNLGTTTLIITHNAATAGLSDRTFYFLDGKISRIEKNHKKLMPKDIKW